MERAHGELRAGFTDGLGGNDADRFTDVDHVATREVAAVAHGADTTPRLAGEHRADDDALDAGVLDAPSTRASSIWSLALRMTSPVTGSVDVFERHAAEDAFAERLHDFAALFERLDPDAVERAAIDVRDHGVLRHVDETTREVTGVGGLECSVGETLTGAVASR